MPGARVSVHQKNPHARLDPDLRGSESGRSGRRVRCSHPSIPPSDPVKRTFALLALLLPLGADACSRRGSPAPEAHAKTKTETDKRPPLVRVRALELRKVQGEVRTTGYLEAERQVPIVSKVAGRVLEVRVDEAQRVEKGDVLAVLDDREARTTVQQVEVQIEATALQRDLSSLEADAARGRYQQACIERDKTAAEYKRNAEMEKEYVSPKILEEAKFALDKAEEAVRVAEFDRRKALIGVSTAENKGKELAAKKAEIELAIAEHTIRAPFDGVVVARKIRGGEMVSPQTELFTVADPDDLVAYLTRPQSELALVRNARRVPFTADAYGDTEFVGDVDMLSPVVDQQTGSFRLRIRVRKEDAKKLMSGMFLRARILTEELRDALMVPKAAVLADGEKSVVFAVREGKAIRVALDPGLEERAFVECRNLGDGGLNPGDVVITSGHENLKDQTVVEVGQD
jgi:RND family efflux transporter MFP subunit